MSEPAAGRLAEQLLAARRWAGMTQQQLAGLSTVSVRAIRDLEQGRVLQPRRETLRLLSDSMRLSAARRAALEMAVAGLQADSVMRETYGAELAPPPKPLRRLVGRTEELRTLNGLLTATHERLLTVVGLAGVGKTRLVQEVSLQLHTRDRMPVLWIDMSEAAQPALTTAARSPRSALTDWARSLAGGGPGLDELASVIGDRATLLVLDGYVAAPHIAPELLALLHSCERVKALITAREPHHTPGNRLIPLAPLPVPGPGQLADADADADAPGSAEALTGGEPAFEVMLSAVAHMRPELMPTNTVVRTLARICRALDGVPRAMESAASWLLLYSLEDLLQTAQASPLNVVDEADGGQADGEGLAAALSTAVQRLPDGQASLLSSLSALPGGWTTDHAASTLLIPQSAMARDAHELILRGLVRRLDEGVDGPARFTVLNLVRQLAAERSGASASADRGPGLVSRSSSDAKDLDHAQFDLAG
jgi:transcriptional regulator with XRE-family HTH domain